MTRAIFSALAALLLMTGILAAQSARPLLPDDAFSLAASRRGDDIRLHWTVTPGYYLYRDQLSLEADGGPVALDIPAGEVKDDENFGRVEVFYDALTLPLPAAGGPLVIRYQGCQEAGLCYAQIAKKIDPETLDITNFRASDHFATSDAAAQTAHDAPAQDGMTFSPTLPGQAADDDTTAAPAVTGSGGADTVSGLLGRGGYLWVAGGFLLFGLVLAFTPCVLPMYPILAATLAREGETLTRARGFSLSLTYVLAMAFAFSILGVFAGLTGGNLQIALQSPWAVTAISALFVVLSLSMFGLFELQLPTSWVNCIGGAQTGRRGSYLAAGGMGFTSALIVGPCVTAPLAGALIYIARTGDMVLGALALFLLGLGQGIPLIAFGAFGASALPRRGAWMETVKLVFAFVFLAAAIWMVSRILPGPAALALWAALAMGAALALGGFDRPGAGAGKLAQVARAGGLMAALGAVLLAVGAALGADDPLRPLAPLAKASAA